MHLKHNIVGQLYSKEIFLKKNPVGVPGWLSWLFAFSSDDDPRVLGQSTMSGAQLSRESVYPSVPPQSHALSHTLSLKKNEIQNLKKKNLVEETITKYVKI